MQNYIWDLDGTLLDSYGAIVSSLVGVAAEQHLTDAFPEIMNAVKRESVSAYLRSVSERSGTDLAVLYQRYRDISHSEARTEEITLIPGAAETLRILQDHGARHFVYTHRGPSGFPILERLGVASFFTEIVTSVNGFRPKPSGEGITYLVEKYGLLKDDTAYVGDRSLDVYSAIDAGVKAVLFLPADSPVSATGKEDLIIRKLSDLLRV